MYLFSVNFKNSATPFAEALVELHHEIMFYLIVIVSIVIYILVSAINITRVREIYFFSNSFSFLAFLKSIFINFFSVYLVKLILDSKVYYNFRLTVVDYLDKYIPLLIESYPQLFTFLVTFYKNACIFIFRLEDAFSFFESLVLRLIREFRGSGFVSYPFFYKTGIISSYYSYLAELSSYLKLMGFNKILDYNLLYKNKYSFYTYFSSFSSSKKLNPTDYMTSADIEKLYVTRDFLSDNHNSVLEFFNSYLGRLFSFSGVRIKSFNSHALNDLNSSKFYSFLNAQSYTVHNTKLEIIWTIIPTIILVLIAVPSFILLYSLDEVINPSVTLKAIGHQWYWSYEYSDYTDSNSINFDSYMLNEKDLEFGQFRLLEVDNRVVLPVNTHIRVLITAGDVLHSWAMPSMNVKADAVPGRLNQLTLFIKRPGVYYGQCSELCGVNHGFMPIVVEAVSLWNYSNWLSSRFEESGVDFSLSA